MKIILFTESLASGGAERQLVGLANLLIKLEYKVIVVTYFNIPFYADFLSQNNIDYVCVPKAANKYFRLFYLLKYFRVSKPDIVISYLDTPNIISLILRILGLDYKLIVSERNTTQRLSIKEYIKFSLYRFSDIIIPNSFTQKQFIQSNFPKLNQKIRLIINFVDTDIFCPSTEEVLRYKGNLKILVIGRIDKQKNTLRFIEAIYKAKKRGCEIRVDWYGDNFFCNGLPTKASEYYLEAAKFVNQLNMEQNFEFHEPTKDVIEIYQSADVLCLPSTYEGFPNAICEAMACGKPILAGNICDNPLLVESGVNGFLFDPYSSESMANIIERFTNSKIEDRARMGFISREKAILLFSKSSFVNKYIELFKQ